MHGKVVTTSTKFNQCLLEYSEETFYVGPSKCGLVHEAPKLSITGLKGSKTLTSRRLRTDSQGLSVADPSTCTLESNQAITHLSTD